MSRSKKSALLLLVACVGLSLAVVGSAGAQQRRVVTIHEEATLKLTQEAGSVSGVGSVTGTIKGRVHLTLTVDDASHISAQFSTAGPGGGVVGNAAANYTVSGSILRFSGTSKVTGGSGPYANARGHGIQFQGVMNRSKATMTVTLDGTIRK